MPADHRAPRGGRRRPRLAAHHHGPLGRRRLHADPARPRLRRRRGGDQLGADRGRQGGAAVADPRGLPGAEEPRQPPQGRRASRYEQWHYAFTNTFSEEESRRLYERYHIPASGSIFWGSALANIHPGKDDNWVDYHNEDRAPLLFISGSEDHLMPPKIQRSNAKHYKAAGTVTEVKEFEGPHLLPAREGWEEVADYALTWALEPRRRPARRTSHRHDRPSGSPTSAGRPR